MLQDQRYGTDPDCAPSAMRTPISRVRWATEMLRLVLGHGLMLVAVGLALGLIAALALTAIIPPDLLPRVSVRDPLTFAGTSALLGAVVLVACYVPAWRATRIDPLIALRTE